MKKFVIAAVVIAAIVVAAILFLHATVPATPAGVRFPLNAAQTALLAHVPSSARDFALIPTAAAVYARLHANPITTDAVEKWAEEQRLPNAWMIGGADLVAWHSERGTSYAIRLDPLRATLVRTFLILGGSANGRWEGTTFLINAPDEPPIDTASMSRVLSLASALPPGDAFVVQREEDRTAFPPLTRPAVTSVSISAAQIGITSRAPAGPELKTKVLNPRYGRSPILTAMFASAPRAFDDLNRIFLTRVSPLVRDGGGIAIFDVDTGTLLPSPKCVIILPPDDPRREALQDIVRDTGGLVQTAEKDGQLLVSFDTSSIGRHTSDTFDPARWPSNVWAVRLDPQRLVPILKRLTGSTGLRLAAPRLYRTARQMATWIGPLEQARTIEAAASASGGTEELRVAVTSK